MGKSRGRRFDNAPRLNIKKVIAVIVAIIVIIMVIISLKNLLNGNKTKEVSSITTYVAIYTNSKWGVIDNKGEIIIEPEYEEMIVIPDKSKDIFVCVYEVNYENGIFKTKVLNKNNKEILTNFEKVAPIENTDGINVWYESDILKYEKNGKFGLINFKGKKIIEPEYDNIYALKGIEKSIIIEKNGNKGLVSTSIGEIIINAEYSDIQSLSNTYEKGYIVKNDNNESGLISADKKMILDVKYDEIKSISNGDFYVVVESGVLKVIDKSENVLLSSGYDSIEGILGESFIIIKENKYGVISKDGSQIIPETYEELKYTFQGYYIAKQDGKYGIISEEKTVVDFEYDNMYYVEVGDFVVAENSDYTSNIYDHNFEKKLSEIIISEINTEDGYLRIRDSEEYKYFNFKFEEKTNKETLASNTLFLVKKDGKYGYENKNGDLIVDYIYDDAKEQNKFGYCSVKKDGVWGSLKSDGTVVLEPSINLDDYLYIDFISSWYRYNDLSLNVYTK